LEADTVRPPGALAQDAERRQRTVPTAGPKSPATKLSPMPHPLPTLAEIETAATLVYRAFQATPQYRWALLSQRLGTECWLKHENHNPVGAFKIRGGLTYFDVLQREGRLPKEVMSATRGNHGQSIAWAARSHGVACTIVVPRGNSVEKNAAMRALGAQLIEHGDDFQDSREHALRLAHRTRGAHGAEFPSGAGARGQPPIGGSSSAPCPISMWPMCRSGWARVPARPSPPSRHWATGCGLSAWSARMPPPMRIRWPPGMWWRRLSPPSLPMAWPAGSPSRMRWRCWRRTSTMSCRSRDAEVADAMRALFHDTHNVAEGAGAAAFGAALQERSQLRGLTVGATLCGGNVDSAVFARVLAGG
jgi:threonine dehydratase